MFQCYSYTIIRELINSCLLKLQLEEWLHIYQPHLHRINHTLIYLNGLFYQL